MCYADGHLFPTPTCGQLESVERCWSVRGGVKMILAGNEGVGTLCMCPLFTDMRPSPLPAGGVPLDQGSR